MAGALGSIIGPILSPILGGVGNDLAGKLTGSTNVPFVPQGLEGVADKNWQQMFGQLWDQMQKNNPQLAAQLQSAFTGAQGMQPQIQSAYQGLAGMTPQMMQTLMGQAGTAQGAQQGLMGAGNQLWQTALDPNNALRNQLQQQVQDTSRAGSSMRGIGMGPQAVGLEDQANTNFMNAWEQDRINRQLAGLQGMTQAYNQAGQQGQAVGRNLAGALDIGAAGPQFLQQGAQWPFQLANLFGGGMQSNIFGPLEQGMLTGQNYMNTGVPASANRFDANQGTATDLIYGLGNLGSLYKPGPTGDPNAPQPYATGQSYDPSGLYG